MEHLGLVDFIIGPIMLALVVGVSYIYSNNKSKKDPSYKLFFRGSIIKLIGCFAYCGIYLFYYAGGDTLDYHYNAISLLNLAGSNFSNFMDVMLGSNPEYLSYFNQDVGYLNVRHYADANTFNVSRLMVPFEAVCFQSFIGTSILVSFVSYLGLWRIYRILKDYFPAKEKILFYTVLCVPSVVFWTGGISKEVIIIFTLSIFLEAVYRAFIRREALLKNILLIGIMIWGMISIRPFMFIAVFPATLIWVMHGLLLGIRSPVIRFISFPVLSMGTLVLAFFVWQSASNYLGEYSSVDQILESALVKQQDLQHERYDGTSFDIGAFEPTISGVLGKFDKAVIAGLYRPFIFEANNIVMLFSGIEGSILIFFSVIALFRFRTTLLLIRRREIIAFALIFSVLFAFSVGLSTSNFGALVRYRIPILPFFIPLVVLPFYLNKKHIREM